MVLTKREVFGVGYSYTLVYRQVYIFSTVCIYFTEISSKLKKGYASSRSFAFHKLSAGEYEQCLSKIIIMKLVDILVCCLHEIAKYSSLLA